MYNSSSVGIYKPVQYTVYVLQIRPKYQYLFCWCRQFISNTSKNKCNNIMNINSARISHPQTYWSVG